MLRKNSKKINKNGLLMAMGRVWVHMEKAHVIHTPAPNPVGFDTSYQMLVSFK